MRLGPVVLAVGIGCLVAVGCDGGAGTLPLLVPGAAGTGGDVVQGMVSGDIVSLPVSIEGTPAMAFVVDTGSPLTLVDPGRFASLGLGQGAGTVSTLDVGDLHLANVPILAASPCGVMMCSDGTPSGLLGGDVLTNYDVLIDYQAGAVGFDVTSLPAGLGTPSTSSFDLLGGGHVIVAGNGTNISVPATRIAVTVSIEGTNHPFMVDTGSSQVLLSPALFDAVVSDGRSQGTASVLTVTGASNEPTTTLRSVALGDASQPDVAAVRSPFALDALSSEIGHPIEGLLGGSYLTRYLVSIDYPTRQITLWAR